MKERMLFVGIGLCGSNIVSEFEKLNLDYNVMCINTSNKDLDTINCKVKYHVPAAYGCNKDRMKALEFAKEYWQTMCNVIDRNFPRQDIIYFCYSLGGGTGSGIAPILADIASKRNPKKKYGVITVMPNKNEIIQSLKNTEICYKQTTNLEHIRPIYVIDNNSTGDIFELNTIFAERFNSALDMSYAHKRGVIDESEIEDIVLTKGNIVIEEWTKSPNGMMIFKPSIFTPHITRSTKSAVVSTEKINVNELRHKIGFQSPPYCGYSETKNMFVASGIPYPEERIREFQQIIKNHKDNDLVRGLDYNYSYEKIDNNGDLDTVDNLNNPEPKFDNSYFDKWM